MFSILKSLKEKLTTTRSSFVGRIAEVFALRAKIDEEMMEDLEDILLQADVGPNLSIEIINDLRNAIKLNNIKEPTSVQESLLKIIQNKLVSDYIEQESFFEDDIVPIKPKVILIVGVNGTGKTTSIGKIASQFVKQGKTILLIAGDTFRAAAIEQLTIWAERSNTSIYKKESGSDPSSVIYEGLNQAITKSIDIVLIDTAGRQHNKANLMEELKKIGKTIAKVIPNAPHETLLVLDSTTGQNAISQAQYFNEVTPISGIMLTKFDGTAKGGIVIAVKNQLNIPVKLIGMGETIDDIKAFNAVEFSQALFG